MITPRTPTPKRIAVVDVETDGLYNPTTIWCAVVKDLGDNSISVFTHEDHVDAQAKLLSYDYIVGHNFIFFDWEVLKNLWGITIPPERVIDSLVLSQLLNAKREGGHSLEAWGDRLGYAKIAHDDWSKFSKEMLDRCIGDVHLNHMVYDHLMKIVLRNTDAFTEAFDVELKSRWIAKDMHDNGFKFDIVGARKMHSELIERLDTLSSLIREAFPPRAVPIREVTPKLTKHGTISRVGISTWYEGNDYTIFSEGAPFTLVEWEPFNPSSPKQVIDRLWEAGWQPTDRTKGHEEALKSRDKDAIEKFKVYGWKVNEQNISTLPEGAPEACSYLVEYNMVDARRRTLEEWFAAYNEKDGRIHGVFNPLGTKTHRCSHTSPNMGNIVTKKTIKYNTPHLRKLATEFGGRMRAFWICEDDAWLVGTDMESAHLRIFAHLIDDEDFTKALLEGKKEDGTDPHSLNKQALGDVCVDRDRAKTFIFSFLNGARAKKVSDIFGCTLPRARAALGRFTERYKGLARINNETTPADARRGFFVGVDGRLVVAEQEHGMMGMYLQNMESVLMKYANIRWRNKLTELGIRFKQVNWVHDEWVTEVYGTREEAELVGRLQSESIKEVGQVFKLRCPMGGESKVGKNWLEVH